MDAIAGDKEEDFFSQQTFRDNPDEARRKIGDFKLKAWDGHAHSFYSRDIKERPEFHPVEIFFTGLKSGMDFVTITDHDEYTQNEVVIGALKNRPGLLKKFVPGTEFTVCDKSVGHVIHVNVYTHTRKDFEILMNLRTNLLAFASYCMKKKLMFQYNHPLWFEMSRDPVISEKTFESILKFAKLFEVIEISNSNRALYENLAGEFLTKILGKGGTSGSDGHFGDVGSRGYTLARGENFREYWGNIVKGDSHVVRQNLKPETLRGFALDSVDYIAYPTKIKRIGRYQMETGSRRLSAMMGMFDRFPILLRPISPYVKMRIRRTRLIEDYVENQNVIGKSALECFVMKRESAQFLAAKMANLEFGK